MVSCLKLNAVEELTQGFDQDHGIREQSQTTELVVT